MTDRLSLIIAFAALVLSIVSPLVSAWISGRYRIKEIELQQEHELAQHRQNFYVQHRAEVIEKYVHAAGAAIYGREHQGFSQFGEECGEIFFYVDKGYWHLIDSLNEEIRNRNYIEANKTLSYFCTELAVFPPRSDDRRDDREENDSCANGKKDQNKKEWRPKRLFQFRREKKARSDGGDKAKGHADNGKNNG